MLARLNFVSQSESVNAYWAEENLNTIRCLMEQASVYRRAMAPVAIVVGLIGLAAAGLAQTVDWAGPGRFAGGWSVVAMGRIGLGEADKRNEPRECDAAATHFFFSR